MSISKSTDPADLGAVEARSLIARKALSPVELAEACIRRIEEVNPAVNAMVALDLEGLRKASRAAEADVMSGKPLGALHGLPIGIKDMVDVKGLPTTFGSLIFKDNIAAADDASVTALRAAGGIPMGKTNNPEWSAGANTVNRVYGATANPHDLTRSSAGSSGGSAAALASGMVPLATGSDLGGSLRNPASFCGVVGYRPSFGVVPGGARATALFPLGTSGPMARSVADAGLLLSIQAQPDNRDPYTAVVGGKTAWAPEGFANLPRRDLSSLRIAVTDDYGYAPTESIVRSHFAMAIKELSPLFASVEETHPDCTGADRIFSVLRSVMFLGHHAKHLDEQPDLVGDNVRQNVLEGRSYSAEDVGKVLVMHSTYQQAWQRFFETADFILAPAVTISPRDWHELYPTEIDGKPTKSYYHWLGMAYASTLSGHPSITIPCGKDANGMPFGLQIVGHRHDDLGVLTVAAELERVIAASGSLALAGPDIAALRKAAPLSETPGFLTTG
ncbi:Asp-tRNAAsn/Glu-tRNAGln amidotransferase A subunit [Roseibium suaedae]|uniref:Asp-tRNAAsn/Glu-tRNAGln amidotransferase A subunit n=1 Tax=Roseibium suaedae TaxID=735517 RepID=A0A1M7A8G3_9HYPH|nr:Asp-tRNAAsn/Glu-tRNAGln amidotransferase A subunit [Roseibium suaedae]